MVLGWQSWICMPSNVIHEKVGIFDSTLSSRNVVPHPSSMTYKKNGIFVSTLISRKVVPHPSSSFTRQGCLKSWKWVHFGMPRLPMALCSIKNHRTTSTKPLECVPCPPDPLLKEINKKTTKTVKTHKKISFELDSLEVDSPWRIFLYLL